MYYHFAPHMDNTYAHGMRAAGWSGIVGQWFDLPPGTEEGILQSTPTALQAPAKGNVFIRSDFDTGANAWELATDVLQVGLSRAYPDSSEFADNGTPRFYALRRAVDPDAAGFDMWTVDGGDEPIPAGQRMLTSKPLDLKTSSVLYTGLDQTASITVEESLILAIDPQAQGPLAPNRAAPVGCSTSVLDLVSAAQQKSKAIVHSPHTEVHNERGLIGNLLGGIGTTLATLVPGPWGQAAGVLGQISQTVGNHLNLVPAK